MRNHVSLVDALRAQGLKVEPTGSITQPFFPIPGQTLNVNDQNIQVFEFEDSSTAKSHAQEISPDGLSIGQTSIQWNEPPHIFSTGTIIVLYLGTDASLLSQLEMALGQQIAGAQE